MYFSIWEFCFNKYWFQTSICDFLFWFVAIIFSCNRTPESHRAIFFYVVYNLRTELQLTRLFFHQSKHFHSRIWREKTRPKLGPKDSWTKYSYYLFPVNVRPFIAVGPFIAVDPWKAKSIHDNIHLLLCSCITYRSANTALYRRKAIWSGNNKARHLEPSVFSHFFLVRTICGK